MQPSTIERELKLAVPGSFMLPDLTGDGLGIIDMRELPDLELRSTYYDSADLRLARSGATLRYRTGEEGGPIWTVKLPIAGRDATEREEHTFEGGSDEVPAAAVDLVTALARSEPLAAVAALQTRRHRWLLCAGGDVPLAELADDEVAVLDGEQVVSRFRELELESRGPDLDQLLPIAALLRRAGAVIAEPVPKAIRALGPRAAAAADVVPISIDPAEPASRVIQAALADGFLRLTRNDPGLRLGDGEALHQMRVATRRLRSDLRTFGALLDSDWVSALNEELGWIGDLLGRVRDLDVQLLRLNEHAPDLASDLAPMIAGLQERRNEAREPMLQALRSDRYRSLLDLLVDAVRNPVTRERVAEIPASKAVRPLLDRAWQRLEKQAETLSDGADDAEYHRVRIRAKRLRYAAEAVVSAMGNGAEATRGLARRAADLQDLLGSMQDSRVAFEQIERARAEHPDDVRLAFAAGRLMEREALFTSAARNNYPTAWKRLRKQRRRAMQ
ncbi:MAG: CYTH and CHAD domain-containing protein [Chloroflexota bacterium]|nr:CYTH and CHAD domain-containing protein [Chloroflexota bacterium]